MRTGHVFSLHHKALLSLWVYRLRLQAKPPLAIPLVCVSRGGSLHT